MAQLIAEEEARSLFAQERRRRTVDRMELSDQPVLDQFQGPCSVRPWRKELFCSAHQVRERRQR